MQSFSTMRKHFRMEISSWYFSFTGNIFFFKGHLSRSFYLRYNLQNFLSFFESKRCDNFHYHFAGNTAKGQISKRAFQENKERQIFWKTTIFYPMIGTPPSTHCTITIHDLICKNQSRTQDSVKQLRRSVLRNYSAAFIHFRETFYIWCFRYSEYASENGHSN